MAEFHLLGRSAGSDFGLFDVNGGLTVATLALDQSRMRRQMVALRAEVAIAERVLAEKRLRADLLERR